MTQHLSIERVVALLTPVFAAAAGWLSTEIATLVNVQIPRGDFTAIFIAGATTAGAAAIHWLHGRQKFVAFTDQSKIELEKAVGEIRTELAANAPAQAAVDDIRGQLAEHKTEILDAIDSHVPQLVAQVLGNVFSSLGKQQQSQFAGTPPVEEPKSGPTGVVPPPPITTG